MVGGKLDQSGAFEVGTNGMFPKEWLGGVGERCGYGVTVYGNVENVCSCGCDKNGSSRCGCADSCW
jgi:hypothetical protein